MNRINSAMGAALLASTAMFVFLGGTPPSEFLSPMVNQRAESERTAALPHKQQKEAAEANADGAEEMICEFLGIKKQPITSKLLIENGLQVQCLIATIPDPEHSRLSFLFDVYLDAMQRAAETAGYVQDRIKLPWKKERPPIAPVLTVPEKKEEEKARKKMEHTPGIILFRKEKPDAAKRELLFLFLVGETPTNGIYKDAIKNALSQVHEYAKLAPETPHEFKVLGPTLSGSATSLSLAVKNWRKDFAKCCHLKFQFIGTATSLNKTEFEKEIRGENSKSVEVSWHGTMLQDEYARQAFYDYLLNKLGTITPPPNQDEMSQGWFDSLKSLITPTDAAYQVAVLTEGSTAYGRSQQATTSPTPTPTSMAPSVPSPKPIPIVSPSPSPLSNYHNKVLHLTFPLHISRLRSLRWKNGGERNTGINDPFNLQSAMTPLPMEDDQETTVPVFSAVSASFAEVALATILEEIERQKIRYLGIIATDVRDRLFLAREIRRHSPNLVLFFLTSELLFLHPEVNRDLQGSLLVSTYPLAPQTKLWSQSLFQQRKWLQFPMQSAQGVYNAMLALLGNSAAMQDYEAPTFGQPSQGSNQRPALWLSVVGRDNIWPLTTLQFGEKSKYYMQLPAEDRKKIILPDQYLTTPTATPESVSFYKNQGGRERLHSVTAYIAFYLFVLLVCGLPAYSVFVGWWEFLKKYMVRLANIRTRQTNLSVAPSPPMENKRKNLAWQWGWMILGDVVDPKDDNLYLRRKIYLAGCLLAMLCLSLPVWLISAIPMSYSDYRKSFTTIDQRLIFVGFILISLGVLFHLSGLWVIIQQVVFRFASGIVLRSLVYLVGGGVAALCLTLPVWLIFIHPLKHINNGEPSKGYWESLSNPSRWMILAIGAIASIILVLYLVVWLVIIIQQARHNRSATQEKPPNDYRKRDFVISLIFVLGVPLLALFLLVGLHFLPFYLEREKAELILLWERTVGNFSGISPLMPLALIATGTLTWAFCCLRRLRLLERKPSNPSLGSKANDELGFLALEKNGTEESVESEGTFKLEQRIHKMLSCPLNQLPTWHLTTAGVVFACLVMMGARLMPSVEGVWFNRGITALFILAYLAIALNFLRFLCIWAALRRLLRRLSWHPLLMGYRPPKEDQNAALDGLRLDLSSPLPTFTALTKSVKQARLLKHKDHIQFSGFTARLDLIENASKDLKEALNYDASNNWAEALETRNDVRAHLIKLSEEVARIIRPFWIEESRGGSDYRKKQPEVSLTASSPQSGQLLIKSFPPEFLDIVMGTPAEHAFLEQGERFLVSHLIGFLQYVLAQMQNLVVFVTAGILLMLGAVLSYPFQPMSPLLIFNWFTIIGVVSITMLVFVQMNRNPTLSLLSGTKPGQLEWNSQFILQVVVHGVLPLLAITGAQFSEPLGELLKWVGVTSLGDAH